MAAECRAGHDCPIGRQSRCLGAPPRGLTTAARVRVAPLAIVAVAAVAAAFARAHTHVFLAPGTGELGSVRLSRRSASSVIRHVQEEGEFGVLPETPSPVIDTSDEPDPLFEQLVAVVQAADQKRGVDMTAFWTRNGYEIVFLVTALSRPQLQAIANAIELKMRHGLKIKRTMVNNHWGGERVRREASIGWACMTYPRLTVHIQTPIQRNYYDIESVWRDDNKDYQKIPLDELLREDTFGNLQLTKELGGGEKKEAAEEPVEVDAGSGLDYEEDEEDPFWS